MIEQRARTHARTSYSLASFSPQASRLLAPLRPTRSWKLCLEIYSIAKFQSLFLVVRVMRVHGQGACSRERDSTSAAALRVNPSSIIPTGSQQEQPETSAAGGGGPGRGAGGSGEPVLQTQTELKQSDVPARCGGAQRLPGCDLSRRGLGGGVPTRRRSSRMCGMPGNQLHVALSTLWV